jgi:DNA mismatch repair ATPase MutS
MEAFMGVYFGYLISELTAFEQPKLTISCRTRMGRRLMREWIGRPLLDIGYVALSQIVTRLIDSALQARIDAIEEIINEKTYHMEKLRGLLVNIPDLVKGLTRIQYGKVYIQYQDTTEI